MMSVSSSSKLAVLGLDSYYLRMCLSFAVTDYTIRLLVTRHNWVHFLFFMELLEKSTQVCTHKFY